jgi:hypothetical protein
LVLHTAWHNSHTGLHNITRWSTHFTYCSHYFWWQSSDNRETRWHNMLIQSIADMNFIYGFCDWNARAAWKEYNQYPHQKQPNRCVFAMAYCHQHTMAVVEAMCRMKGNCQMLYALITNLALIRSHSNRPLSDSSQAYTTWAAKVFFSCTTCRRATSKGQWSLPPVLLIASTQNCRWTWLYVARTVDCWGNNRNE